MPDLVVVEFKEPYEADALLIALQELDKKDPIDLDDSVVVVKDKEGKVFVDKALDAYEQLPASGALYFGFVGAVTGWILTYAGFWGAVFGLQAGILLGWIAGVLTAWLGEVGIPQAVIEKLAKTIEPGTSGLCVLTRTPLTSASILPHLTPYEARLVLTSLPADEEAKLRTALS
jgi:uncharacterized membrane protein